jgi:hypothetical protein
VGPQGRSGTPACIHFTSLNVYAAHRPTDRPTDQLTGHSIHFILSQAIVLVHGACGTRKNWFLLGPALAEVRLLFLISALCYLRSCVLCVVCVCHTTKPPISCYCCMINRKAIM